jgi:hypothetical protein
LNTAKKTIDLVHKTWLAGVGTYDSGREKASNKFDQLFVDGSAFVNDLLVKGESVETQLKAKIEAKNMLKDKISALRTKLGFGNESRDQQVDMLSQRVDTLIEVVARLAQQKAAEKKITTTAKKAPAKTATKTTAKASSIKASAKPTAAKSEASKPETVKSKAAKPETVKSKAAKPEAVNPEAAKPEAVKPEAAKPEAVKPEAVKPEAAKPEAESKD